MRLFTLAHVVCLWAALVSTSTQTATGALHGVVTDSAGAVIPGARIELTAPGFAARSVFTDEKGEFRVDKLPVGEYVITVGLTGFTTEVRRITIEADRLAKVTLKLNVSALEETVTVSAASASTMTSTMTAHIAGSSAAASPPDPPNRRARFNTEAYDRIEDNPFRLVRNEPLSTFAVDVDTASYANVRRFLNDGTLPPPDAVRIEELINYFRFDYPRPTRDDPFSVTTELGPCPWKPEHRLALIGLQARRPDADLKTPRNLVFLLDVSGSMESPDKLPLVRAAMRMLVDTLTASDRVAIVVYAGASGLVLPSTPGVQKDQIHGAIGRLEAGGSTNGAAGITLAYDVAQAQFVKGGVNRVILATDGDFNVGVTNQGELIRLIERKRESGIFLSVLGVGTGNLKDSTMEKLADKGNGNYSYLDSLHEARKVLIAEAGSTLETVAQDVKIQVEFNPARVAAYRLIGYENRLLDNEDFDDDRKDAGEIGAGHTVTALYEIVPPGVPLELPAVDPLKYQRPSSEAAAAASSELMTVKLRYKQPEGETSRLMSVAVQDRSGTPGNNLGFAAAVAQFGMLLRDSEHRGTSTFRGAADLARRFRGKDESGYRIEFVRLVELAQSLAAQKSQKTTTR